MVRQDPPTLLACVAVMLGVGCLFAVPVNGKTSERPVHYVRRYARFCARKAVGKDSPKDRQREGRHSTHPKPVDSTPLSHHLGRVALTSFAWSGGPPVGMLTESALPGQPWRRSFTVVVQVSGRDQLPLESERRQEQLLGQWNRALDTMFAPDFGLSAIEKLLISRPLVEGEGADWESFNGLLEDDSVRPEDADYYRQVQLLHDSTSSDRRCYLALRWGGTIRSWNKARHSGNHRSAVEDQFRNILNRLPEVLHHASVTLVGVLTPDQIASLLRLAVDPAHAPAVGWRENGRSAPSTLTQVAPISQWEEDNSSLVVNGQHTATFRVTGWPTTVVGPQFLAGQLLNHKGTLRVAQVMCPRDPKTARLTVRAEMTRAQSKAERQAATGRVTTEGDRVDGSHSSNRDVEMTHGHVPLDYQMYLTVGVGDEASLRPAADHLATNCAVVGVDVARCYGDQANAYAYTLPLCRGVG